MNNVIQEKVWIAYLGKRGGGANLLRQTEKTLRNLEFTTLSIVSQKSISTTSQPKVISTPTRNFASVIHLFTFPVVSFKLFYERRKNLPTVLVQVMPSPMDYWLDLWSNFFGVAVYRAIHDFEPHPGEFWPTKKSILRRIKLAEKVFVFSTYVSENLKKTNHKTMYQCLLPEEVESKGGVSRRLEETVKEVKEPLILFIGRIKKYKGLDLLLHTLEEHPDLGSSILIAGAGSIKFKARKNVHLWNHWLSDAEIEYLISASKIVIFPYLEASQSGMVPLAKKKEKIILISKVGSLEEQLKGYESKVLVEPGDQESLLKGLYMCVQLSSQGGKLNQKDALIEGHSFGDQIISALTDMSKR